MTAKSRFEGVRDKLTVVSSATGGIAPSGRP